MQTPALAFAYRFPVFFQPGPIFSHEDNFAEFTLQFDGEIHEEIALRLDTIMQCFAIYIGTGAAGKGDNIYLGCDVHGPKSENNTLKWIFDCVPIMDTVTTLLLNMVEQATDIPIQSAKFTVRKRQALAVNVDTILTDSEQAYPPVVENIPFKWQINDQPGKNITLTIKFKNTLSAKQVKSVESAYLLWVMATENGAYRKSTAKLDHYVQESDAEFDANIMTWKLGNYQAHTAGLYALVNIGMWLHYHGSQIEVITIN
jgi:hypothetical protein